MTRETLSKIPMGYILNTYEEPLKFLYDPRKNEANIEKHGIGFKEAQAIWNDPDLLKIPAKKSGEKRYLVIGMVQGRCLTAVATDRSGAVRIISARRASEQEAKLYGSNNR